jgi:mRNA interferase RelE/StbE
VKFGIVYTRRAQRDISQLAPETKERIKKALERYSEAPLHYARKMVEPSLGSYRFRIGDYRVIFDMEGNEIVILRVGHRRDLYRRS